MHAGSIGEVDVLLVQVLDDLSNPVSVSPEHVAKHLRNADEDHQTQIKLAHVRPFLFALDMYHILGIGIDGGSLLDGSVSLGEEE